MKKHIKMLVRTTLPPPLNEYLFLNVVRYSKMGDSLLIYTKEEGMKDLKCHSFRLKDIKEVLMKEK